MDTNDSIKLKVAEAVELIIGKVKPYDPTPIELRSDDFGYFSIKEKKIFVYIIDQVLSGRYRLLKVKNVSSNSIYLSYFVNVDRRNLIDFSERVLFRFKNQVPYLFLSVGERLNMIGLPDVYLSCSEYPKLISPIFIPSLRESCTLRDSLVRLILLVNELPDVSAFELMEHDPSILQEDIYTQFSFPESKKINSTKLVKHVSEQTNDIFKMVYKLFISAGSDSNHYLFRPAITKYQFNALTEEKRQEFTSLLSSLNR